MILTGIFQTVEFYVITSVIAAAVVAYMAIPAQRGEAKLHMLAGELFEGDFDAKPFYRISLQRRRLGHSRQTRHLRHLRLRRRLYRHKSHRIRFDD